MKKPRPTVLIPTYVSLWLAGSWVASRNAIKGFVPGKSFYSNWAWPTAANSFLLLSFPTPPFICLPQMGAVEYISRVAQIYVSYVLRWQCVLCRMCNGHDTWGR